MTDKELLEKTAKRLRTIADDTQRITTGNMSHNLTCLRGFALRAAESIERYMQEEPVSEDLKKEIDREVEKLRIAPCYDELVNFAKHFFELGMAVSNPTTAAARRMAEEIAVNLKRVEKDYRIDLTNEMEWLRQMTLKGE